MKQPGVLGWVWDSISNGCYHTGMLLLFLLLLGTKLLTSSSLVSHGFKGQGSRKLLPMIFLKCLSLTASFMARRFKHLCSLRLFVRSPCAFLLQLLPIPDSLPISPDDGQHADIYKLRIRVRGNLEWAPPRPQIIFNVHPAPT